MGQGIGAQAGEQPDVRAGDPRVQNVADDGNTGSVEAAPARLRAVQVTTDLAGFWQRTYRELRPALSRRYPKHLWPEDPARSSQGAIQDRDLRQQSGFDRPDFIPILWNATGYEGQMGRQGNRITPESP